MAAIKKEAKINESNNSISTNLNLIASIQHPLVLPNFSAISWKMSHLYKTQFFMQANTNSIWQG